MASMVNLPRTLEQAAAQLRVSSAPRDESFEELSYAIDLALAAAYRFNAESLDRAPTHGVAAAMSKRPSLVLVASRETPSRRGPSAGSHA